MTHRALYYPYIHVDVEWLKGSLLLFDGVSRMIPPDYTRGPNDDPRIAEFQERNLLAKADLYAPRAWAAQSRLAQKIRESAEDPNFVARYGEAATIAQQTGGLGFQLHKGKSILELQSVLLEKKLGWTPIVYESYDVDSDYMQVHPRVGQAIMSTIAIACAQGEGMDIVGDRRSGVLHHTLLEKDLHQVYDAWLGDNEAPPPKSTRGEDVFEFLIGTHCNLSGISPEALQNLDREPLQHLMNQLRDHAKKIPAMDPGVRRDEYISDTVSDVIKKWHEDRKNLEHFWKVFWGDGAADPAVTFFKTLGDKAVAALSGAAVTVGAAHVALASVMPGALYAATGSLVIGVGVRLGTSYHNMVDEGKKSRYRYLTTLEGAGVTFQSAEKATPLQA